MNPQDQNPYQQPGHQQPNPYQQPGYQQPGPQQPQQPGYQQPNPYQQPVAGQQGQWGGAPTYPGAPQPPGPGGGGSGSGNGGGGNRTKVVAIVAAAAVVVAAGVTGFLILGDDDTSDKADKADSSEQATDKPSPTSDGDDSDRGTGGGPKATVPGWSVVVNPKWGTAFDVPPEWQVQGPGRAINIEDHKTGEPVATMGSPAVLKPKWCTSDDDKDGRFDDIELAAAGTKGGRGGKNTDEVAVNTVGWWIYGGYTQPDKKTMTYDEKAKPYTTKSGIKGSIAWGKSTNTPQRGKCASDGKAITFGFKNSEGEFVSWSLYGARGVKEEIPDATIMKILATVRLYGKPTG
ncbi:hypothetical protein [Streptomyces flavofungini]|uniref:DUF8017 domain-containing protein n=1 Tax=Streptomyces flavofungini TaxID=68200 RepID=A0ABS0XEH9_9ACTN|nr:hypothetical protein [Streptomyces flavofungini]MBJ3811631.1 hypothetical protein [Streptomyces flavofungini]GHC86382.1 hypothetical protein GCM10010349_72450 [Streptomyces flavofungini]